MLFTINQNTFEVKALNCDALNSDLIQQWEELETRSIEGNAYLSPHFILPAIKYLTPYAKVIIVFITRVAGNTRMLTGVGVFEYSYGSKQFPLPHLRTYRCIHSYLSGLLVDETYADSTLSAFFRFIRNYKPFCCGVEFIKRTGDTELAKKIEHTASQLAVPWHPYDSKKRVMLIPRKLNSDYIDSMFSSRMKKNIRYSRNVLSKTGEIRWKFIKGHEVDGSCIDRFLDLEHIGWKNTAGSSLRSKPGDEAFFREMMAGFAKKGHVFFTELTVNGRSIASTVNLLSAKAGYAFKIGWDTEFASASPGILNEVEFITKAAELFPELEYIDSGAEEGSFIEKLWPDSYTLVSGYFVTKPFARPIAVFIDFARRIKQRFRKIGRNGSQMVQKFNTP